MQPDAKVPLAEIRERFEGKAENLIPMLQTLQKALGYLPEAALLEIAQFAKLPAATVFGVATFYEQFRLNPVGKHIVKLCRGTACHVRGAERILNELQASFHVKPGETTEDGSFTLETVACFGSCALAPVVVVNETVKGRMTPSKTREALGALLETAEPSTRSGRAAEA